MQNWRKPLTITGEALREFLLPTENSSMCQGGKNAATKVEALSLNINNKSKLSQTLSRKVIQGN